MEIHDVNLFAAEPFPGNFLYSLPDDIAILQRFVDNPLCRCAPDQPIQKGKLKMGIWTHPILKHEVFLQVFSVYRSQTPGNCHASLQQITEPFTPCLSDYFTCQLVQFGKKGCLLLNPSCLRNSYVLIDIEHGTVSFALLWCYWNLLGPQSTLMVDIFVIVIIKSLSGR